MAVERDDRRAESLRPLNLAVLGWVQRGHGSVASAFYELCRALLAQGHAVDFYADASFIEDPAFEGEHFEYVPIDVVLRHEIAPGVFPTALRPLADRLRGRRRTAAFRRLATAEASRRHLYRPYDAFLFLGTPPRSAIPGVPTVVWPQSAPQAERAAVRGLGGPVSRVSGRRNYAKLRLYYEIKDRFAWRWTPGCLLILASDLSRSRAVSFGVPAERIHVSPYPIDLDRFAPSGIPLEPSFRILCVGRLDPRKRIDLLVDAVEILATRRSDFHVEVIGRDGYLPGWSEYVRSASKRLPISYTAAVPQEEILRRLTTADLLVQPSEHEEFGHAVAEALACGVPVVTGVTNGTSQYSPPNGGSIFERYCAESLAGAIDRALGKARDPEIRASCRRAADAFSASKIAAGVAQFIAEAQGRPRL